MLVNFSLIAFYLSSWLRGCVYASESIHFNLLSRQYHYFQYRLCTHIQPHTTFPFDEYLASSCVINASYLRTLAIKPVTRNPLAKRKNLLASEKSIKARHNLSASCNRSQIVVSQGLTVDVDHRRGVLRY